MRILYITGQLALHGGIERVTAMKLNFLADHTDNEIYLCTYEQREKPFVYELSQKVRYCDIEIDYNVDYTKESLYSTKHLKKVPKHIWRTWKLIKRIKPDVIVIPNFGYEYQFLPLIKQGARIVREFHDSQYTRAKNPSIKVRVNNWIQRFYDAIVVLTPQEKDYFQYKKNLFVIPNPIFESNKISDRDGKTIISVGRIDPVKGFDKLIEIASLVKQDCPDCRFEIYGTGEAKYVNSLIEKSVCAGLESILYFKGQTNDVYDKMRRGIVYVCTSKTESFGLTLAEAQECGLPVVSFDCPNGPRNIINNGIDGFLVAPGNISQAADAITHIIKDDALRYTMSINARKNAKRFHSDRIMDMWIKLFEQINKLRIK